MDALTAEDFSNTSENTFTSDLRICTELKNVKIRNKIVKSRLSIYESTIENLEFSNCTFEDALIISMSTVKQLVFSDCTFNGRVDLTDNLISERTSIYSSRLSDGLLISNQDIYLSNCVGDATLLLDQHQEASNITIDYHKGNITIFTPHSAVGRSPDISKKIHADAITIRHSENINKLCLHDINASRIKIHDISPQASTQLTNIRTNSLAFTNYTNASGEKSVFSHIAPLTKDASLILVNSNLGKAQVRNNNFSLFSNFTISHSELDLVLTRQTQWPESIMTYPKGKTGSNQRPANHQEKEVYFKACRDIYERSGEKNMYLKFKKLHMDMQYKNLSWSLKSTPAKLSLGASGVFSSHGTNWIKPASLLIIYTIGITLAFHFNSTNGVTTETFFQLLLPTHKFDALGVESSFSNHLLDTLSRLLSGYLIFQTVKSFRSYT